MEPRGRPRGVWRVSTHAAAIEWCQMFWGFCITNTFLPVCVYVFRLDRKWLLWHDFMKEHAHLEMWLHLTEQAITCASPAHITYISAKETLRRIEVSWKYIRQVNIFWCKCYCHLNHHIYRSTILVPNLRSVPNTEPWWLCVSEAAVGGRVSADPVRQADAQESNSHSTVSGLHAIPAAGSGEVLRAAMWQSAGGVGVHHCTTEGHMVWQQMRNFTIVKCEELETPYYALSELCDGLGGLWRGEGGTFSLAGWPGCPCDWDGSPGGKHLQETAAASGETFLSVSSFHIILSVCLRL